MKKKFIVIPAIIALGVGGFFFMKSRQATKIDTSTFVSTAIASKQDISSEISSSGTITPKDTYNITALVSGDIISANFEVGDMVSKDQVLYQIDKSSLESDIILLVKQTPDMLRPTKTLQKQRRIFPVICIALQERAISRS